MIGSVRKRGSARAIARKRGEAVRSEVRNSLPPASLTHLNLVTRFGIHSRPPLLTAGLITCHSSLARVTRNSPPGAPPDPFLISRFPHYLMDSGSCIPAHSTLIPQRSTQLVRLITCHLSLVTSERYSIAIFPPPLSNRTRFNARLPWRTSPLPFRRPAIPLRECGLSLLIFPS